MPANRPGDYRKRGNPKSGLKPSARRNAEARGARTRLRNNRIRRR